MEFLYINKYGITITVISNTYMIKMYAFIYVFTYYINIKLMYQIEDKTSCRMYIFHDKSIGNKFTIALLKFFKYFLNAIHCEEAQDV